MDGLKRTGPERAGPRPEAGFQSRGLVRPRLLAQLDAARPAGLALVIAPAGFGKTTLLTQYTRTHPGPIAWYSVDAADAATGRAAQRLVEVVQAAAPPADQSLLLVIDNADGLIGTPDENVIERFLAARHHGTHVVVAGRRMPALNLLRHEVSAMPGIIGPEQLRFRTWEVERLLAVVYSEPLGPDEVALLTRRTGGWAAGLAMFHLSTRGRPAASRARAVAALSGRWAMARGYLARTLLAGLAAEVRDFLVRTSVFDVLTGPRCDQLLTRSGSERLLEELAHRYGLPITVDGGETYQYHQVLRSHLGAALVEDLGEAEAARWHGRAAALLVTEGAYAEAVRAYARAGDWTAVRGLLARVGGTVTDQPDEIFDDVLPAWLMAEDPWLVYAEARRRLGHGQLHAAIKGFREAEELFGDEEGKRRCRRERRLAAVWLPEEQPARTHWAAWLRAAARRYPAAVAGEATALPGPGGELVRQLAELVVGNVRDPLQYATESRIPDDGGEISSATLGLALLRAGLRLTSGVDATMELDAIADEADAIGVPWLSRMARAAKALGWEPDAAAEAYAIAADCERRGDTWGRVLATFAASLHDWRFGRPNPGQLARLVDECGKLGAGTLQAWARALYALACVQEDLPDAEFEARGAADFAAGAGVPGARIAATVALARLDPDRRVRLLDSATDEAVSIGLPNRLLKCWIGPDPTAAAEVAAARTAAAQAIAARPVSLVDPVLPVSIRCFGGFRLEIAGRPVELSAVRARARSALRLLAMQAGQVVHREIIIEALWPDLTPLAATRNLQVSISALRGLLEPTSERGKAQLLIRSGDAYGIALPPGGYSDTVAFSQAIQRWKELRHSGDADVEIPALRAAIAAYGGELLPEEGPADWAVQARDAFRRQATQLARALAAAELRRTNVAEAVAAAEYCLSLDPHDDEAWQVLIRAYTTAGAHAKVAEVRRRYADMLTSLGLGGAPPPTAVPPAARPAKAPQAKAPPAKAPPAKPPAYHAANPGQRLPTQRSPRDAPAGSRTPR